MSRNAPDFLKSFKHNGIEYKLQRHAGRRNYVIAWTEGRNPRRYSTGTDDPATAEREFDSFIAGLMSPEADEGAPEATVETCVSAYLESLGDDPEKQRVNRWRLRRGREGFGSRLPSRIGKDDVRRYMKERQAAGAKPSSAATELRMLRGALAWAHENGWCEPLRNWGLASPKRYRPRERWLTATEVNRLLAVSKTADRAHLAVFTHLALATAGRKSALLELTWDRIDFDQGVIDLRVGGSWEGDEPESNKRRAKVPMTNTVRRVLEEQRQRARTPYVIEYHGRAPLDDIDKFKVLVREAGLTGWVSPHTLRHTAAVWMAQKGVPIEKIAEYLGHTDINTTRRVYAQYQPEWLDDARAALEFPSEVA